MGNFGHFADVVRKDMGFIKRGIDKGVAWANDAFRIPQLAKKVDDLVWLRNLEDPLAATSYSAPSWPQPWYPGGNTNKKCFFLHVGCANTCLIRLESGLGEMGVFLVDANEKCKCLWIFFFWGGGCLCELVVG